MDIVRRHAFDGAVTAATQAVADKEKERLSAQAGVDAAMAALQSAQAIQAAAWYGTCVRNRGERGGGN